MFIIMNLNFRQEAGDEGPFIPMMEIKETCGTPELAGADLTQIVIGSDAYYAHPVVRAQLKSDVLAAKSELVQALSGIPGSTPPQVTRAIIAYLPPGMPKFVTELKWLLLSIGYMRSSQPGNFKTDLILFTSPESVQRVADQFQCTTSVRSSFGQKETCIILPHIKLVDRPVGAGKAPPPLREYAAYVDSMLVLAEFKHTSPYTYLLRTDLDCFITPGFADWALPDGVAIAVGKGAYGGENSNKHLEWITTNKLGLKHNGISQLGSTWMGYPDVTIAVARLTLALMNWLHTQEFSEYEKKGAGTSSWPHWHWPVILLYGGHIALNQIGKRQILLTTAESVSLDEKTTNSTPLDKRIKHLHIFHGRQMFSKFEAHAGKYQDLSLSEYLAIDTPRNYAVVMAISSMRLSTSELLQYANDPNAMRNKEWIRVNP